MLHVYMCRKRDGRRRREKVLYTCSKLVSDKSEETVEVSGESLHTKVLEGYVQVYF